MSTVFLVFLVLSPDFKYEKKVSRTALKGLEAGDSLRLLDRKTNNK